MKADVITVTPAFAANLLQRKAANRSIVRRRVTAIAEAMRSGSWIDDGSPIRVAPDGRLLDGQHRLSAIVEAEIELSLLVVTVDSRSQLTIDTNRPRSFNDYLAIKEVPNARSLAAATRFLWNYENGVLSWKGNVLNTPYPTLADLWQLFEKRGNALADGDAQSYAVHKYVRCSRALLGGMWAVLSDVDYGDASEFYDYMAMRISTPVPDGVIAFMRIMNNQESSKHGGRRPQREQTALFIKAWNHYRAGTSVTYLRWQGGGRSPDPFPEPR